MPTTAPSGTNGHAPINGRPPINGASAGQGANLRSLPYPHSMPTSPTMFERGNEVRLVFRRSHCSFLTPVQAHVKCKHEFNALFDVHDKMNFK